MSMLRRKRSSAPVAGAEGATSSPVRTDPPPTEEIVAGLQEPLPPGNLEWNRPTLCPRCEDWGYIDRLDLIRRVMQLHCPTCHFHWEISEAQIAASKEHRRREGADSR